MLLMHGIPVHVSENATTKVWVFPKDRFIEYGPEDEKTCRYFGIGHEEVRPAAIMVGGSLLIHPKLWNEFLHLTSAEYDDEMMSDIIKVRIDAVEREVSRKFEKTFELGNLSVCEFAHTTMSAEKDIVTRLVDLFKQSPSAMYSTIRQFDRVDLPPMIPMPDEKPLWKFMAREYMLPSPRMPFLLTAV